jgi:translation initiation factor 2 alpha subunit (eIF-2alpha)
MNKQTQEALKMAIEALEHASERSIIINAYEEVINACKEALEQPAWQGLTDDEIDDIIKNVFSKSTIELNGVKTCSVRDGVRAIEQALKDKNT